MLDTVSYTIMEKKKQKKKTHDFLTAANTKW